jgi:hypothetical protein
LGNWGGLQLLTTSVRHPFNPSAQAGSQISVPLLKQIWGDGDAHRVLVTWAALLVFTGDAEPAFKITNLNIVHVIAGTAMTRPNTRDEIYCASCVLPSYSFQLVASVWGVVASIVLAVHGSDRLMMVRCSHWITRPILRMVRTTALLDGLPTVTDRGMDSV